MRLDLLAALSGVLIALQARANGELSLLLNNGLQAALVSFGSGLISSSLLPCLIQKLKKASRNLGSLWPIKRLHAGSCLQVL
jgi:transporter family-2 protein